MPAIGFIGLGDMGWPMTRHLLESGYDVTVYARGDGLDDVVAAGATPVETYEEVGTRSDVIFLCLPGPDAVESVVFDADGLAGGLGAGTVVIDTTTSLPALTNDLADRLGKQDVTVFSAPISGGTIKADRGELSIMASGDPEVFEEIEDIFEPFSDEIFFVGDDPGQGHAIKLINNFISFNGLLAASEGIALGRQAGLEMETMIEVLNASSGMNHATQHQFPERILPGTYDTGFPLVLFEKDLRLFLEFAESMQVPALQGSVTRNLIGFTRSHFGDDADMTRVYDFFEHVMARDE